MILMALPPIIYGQTKSASGISPSARSIEMQSEKADVDSAKYEQFMVLSEKHYHESYKEPDNEAQRVQSLNRALEAVRTSLKLKRQASAQAFECLLMLELARYQGGEEATRSVDLCKKELEDILRTAPTDHTANFAYGLLSYEVLQVGSVKRFLAQFFFTPLPEDLSYDSALLHLLQAKLSRETPHLYYTLAETYFALNNQRYALESLQKCLSLKEENPYIDAYYKKQAGVFLENYRTRYK
ncbi:MAG: hypothetical protein HGB19_14655 [Chlorobiales bacterium]|nr:hypothetical protein [Chlorobiales bacterium]